MSNPVPEAWRSADDRAQLAITLADAVANNLRAALEVRDTATLAVSGGSTPRPFFEALSEADIDWAQVIVTLVDERWVEESHPDSNARLVRTWLLKGAASTAQFVSLKLPGSDPFAAEALCESSLASFEYPDVVVLGMGTDGHTASFFPGATTLAEALDPTSTRLCLAVRPPTAPHDRMTLSVATILRASHIYLHVTGDEKRDILLRIESGEDGDLPINAVLGRRKDAHIFYAP